MNCGKKVRLNPAKIRKAARRDQPSGYMRPEILGHQKCSAAMKAVTAPPTMT